MWRSVPQIPPANTLTRISPAPGRGTGTSVSSSPAPPSGLSSAFIRISETLGRAASRVCQPGGLGRGKETAVCVQRQAQRLRLFVNQTGDEVDRQPDRLFAILDQRVGGQNGVDRVAGA